jgi:HD-like signal output (HDOD) protein
MLVNTNKPLRSAIVPRELALGTLQPDEFDGDRSSLVPPPPALNGAALRLANALAEPVLDLRKITRIIKEDIGFTIRVVARAAEQELCSFDRLPSVAQLVVHLGRDELHTLSHETTEISSHSQGDGGMRACQQFWANARLTALIAEQLAGQSCQVAGEDAYLAGLLWCLRRLPGVLGWATPWPQARAAELGYRLAKAWHMPPLLADVIGDGRHRSAPASSWLSALVALVKDAEKHAGRLAPNLLLTLADADRLGER